MRGAVTAWSVQALAFGVLSGTLLGWLWFVGAMMLAAWAYQTTEAMGRRATLACVLMAVGSQVWNTLDGWPKSATLLMAGAFLVPMCWQIREDAV